MILSQELTSGVRNVNVPEAEACSQNCPIRKQKDATGDSKTTLIQDVAAEYKTLSLFSCQRESSFVNHSGIRFRIEITG
jgi:hypothetical protein